MLCLHCNQFPPFGWILVLRVMKTEAVGHSKQWGMTGCGLSEKTEKTLTRQGRQEGTKELSESKSLYPAPCCTWEGKGAEDRFVAKLQVCCCCCCCYLPVFPSPADSIRSFFCSSSVSRGLSHFAFNLLCYLVCSGLCPLSLYVPNPPLQWQSLTAVRAYRNIIHWSHLQLRWVLAGWQSGPTTARSIYGPKKKAGVPSVNLYHYL